MSGTEVALLRLATTVIGAAAKALLTPRPGAGLVPDPVRPLPRPAKPDRLAKVLAGRMADAFADLPEHERLAALTSVQDTFAAADEPDAGRLFALELDPERLRAELSAPAAGLSARAVNLYEDLLGRCCAHLVEQLTAHPSFAARAAVEQVRAAGRTRELVEDVRDRVGPRPDAADLDFERRYAEFVATANGRVELFGLTLGRSAGGWPLETAYISLSVSGYEVDGGHGPGQPVRASIGIEQALGEWDRLLLRGPAGSGKSTLVQWLALNAARQTFDGELADWNRCVPFVLRLRAFTALDALPAPADFLRAAGVPLHGSAPAGWADRLLQQGRALVLVDGVDEVPDRLRKRTERWLRDLIAAYPRARYVVTTRPSAVPETWLSGSGFEPHSLLAMSQEDVRAFIEHWHRAARSECRFLALCHPFVMESIGELPVCEQVTELELLRQTRYLSLEGLERWTSLRALSLYGVTHLRQLSRMPSLHNLERMHLMYMPNIDLELMAPLTRLRKLFLVAGDQQLDLTPLGGLTSLTALTLHGDEEPFDLAPLAPSEHMTIHLTHNTRVTGAELFPPERIVRLP
ncbi:NACHT domain-containing protein [Streptomyces anulatus]